MQLHNLHQLQLERLHSLPSSPGTSGTLLFCDISPCAPVPAPQDPPAPILLSMTRWRPVGLPQVLVPPRAHARRRPAGATAPCAISEYAASRTYKGSYHTLWPRFDPSAASKGSSYSLVGSALPRWEHGPREPLRAQSEFVPLLGLGCGRSAGWSRGTPSLEAQAEGYIVFIFLSAICWATVSGVWPGARAPPLRTNRGGRLPAGPTPLARRGQ